MKDIKFRFWSGREMYYMDSKENIEWVLECMKQKLLFDSGLHAGLAYDHIGTDVMQYTGLKDKNGREIFEGDILLTPGYSYWNNSFVSRLDNGKYVTEKDEGVCDDWEDFHWNSFEVIGNIYETAETAV